MTRQQQATQTKKPKQIGKLEYMQALLCGRESPIAEGDGKPVYAPIGYEALSTALLDEAARRELQRTIGRNRYAVGATECYAKIVPVLLEMLRTKETVYAIDSFVEFIVEGARVADIALERFISAAELAELRRTAHVRSAKAAAVSLVLGEGATLKRQVIANAVVAGVSATEIGITHEIAQKCVDQEFSRTVRGCESVWSAVKARADKLEALGVS